MPKNTTLMRELEPPDEATTVQAASAVAALTTFLRAHPAPTARVELTADNPTGQTQVVVPAAAFVFFVDVLAELAQGNTITVQPVHAELTTQQAAEILNVSRPTLIRLLDTGQIPHRRAGNRRKLLHVDVVQYKRKDDTRRQEVLDELTREAQTLGLGY